MGAVEKFLANTANGESDFDFVGSNRRIPAAVFTEKSRLDVAAVFCIVGCGDFNLSDDW